MDAIVTIGTDGKIRTETTIDMSKMATMMQSFASGADESSMSTMKPSLCSDESFTNGLNESGKATLIKCTDLGDYKAKIETEESLSDSPEILILSGVIVLDAKHIMGDSSTPSGSSSSVGEESSDMNPEDLGMSVTESLIFPWSIVYKEGGSLSGSTTISLNLVDPKIAKKKELYIIATVAGKKLKPVEIQKYKQALKKQMRIAKMKQKKALSK